MSRIAWGPSLGPCRSCARPIGFALTGKGRRLPVDPEPIPGGNVELTVTAGVVYAAVVAPDPGVERHVSHFVTCPQADRHRRRR